ncbi:hypothetical protein ABBQ32_011864 [Trebouxia sp. C0010 RCD-2024]
MLHEVYNRIIQGGDSPAQASRQQVQQTAARAAAEELAASAVPHSGDPGVITMPVGGKLTLEQLWSAWEPKKPGQPGCEGIRIYKAESLDLYPSDEPRRHQMRWLRGQDDMNRFDQYKQLFHTLDRLVHKKNSGKRTRDANGIMNNWRRSMCSTPACPINTVAQLFRCFVHPFINSPNFAGITENGQYQAVKKIATLLGVRNVQEGTPTIHGVHCFVGSRNKLGNAMG